MSVAVQTPQRPLPGAFLQTPAVNRQQSTPFSQLVRAHPNNQPHIRENGQTSSMPVESASQSVSAAPKTVAVENLSARERAANTINEQLVADNKYPEIDRYLPQGASSEYEIPSSAAWAPFQKTKAYGIPDSIFEQYNRAQVSTMMGLFAELGHAWVTIDNALYLWDYSHPNPDLIGFEDQPHTITAVALSKPRAGVFVSSITHMLVVATTSDMHLIGISFKSAAGSPKQLELYQTHMSISIRGLDVNKIACSRKTGRIFFAGNGDNDVYELTYQQEERWFQNRCSKINHTSKGLATLKPSFSFSQEAAEYVKEIIVDDSRNLVYTLSSKSTIRTLHMKPNGSLGVVITRTLSDILTNAGHMTTRQDLIVPGVTIINISAIPASEASRLHLLATLSNGARLYLSAASEYGWSIMNASDAPKTMQVSHIKYPPAKTGNIMNPVMPTHCAKRFPPGYFVCFSKQTTGAAKDTLFLASPETARIAFAFQSGNITERFPECGMWLPLESEMEDIGISSGDFEASTTPLGFGNELAVQFDNPTTEIAILTNTGVHTIRRRRLVDVFASIIRFGGGPDGLDADIKKFVRIYGRPEAAATALAVACGQGLENISDTRLVRSNNTEVLEVARRTFIDYGGRAYVVENSNVVTDTTTPTVDMVKPSARHDGIAIYIARLMRSVWKALIIKQVQSPQALEFRSTIDVPKLREIQGDLSRLQEFLNSNKTFIEGLSGPESLVRASTKQEEVSLQAEHRALHSLVVLIGDVIEGISFVLVLFDERVEDIIPRLSVDAQKGVEVLTYEDLFCTAKGKELAKELVKAIVNRNIANGSSVDTVADALRRRCGSFCSAEDVIIFKAQEQLKKAAETGTNSEFGRNLLNESLRLFQQVAGNLSMEYLESAVEQYADMQFFAGAIQLVLSVAKASDSGNRALAWMSDGRHEDDPRKAEYELRRRYYHLIHQIIVVVDSTVSQEPDMIDGQYTTVARRKHEAYDVVNSSDDEVFHTDLYDWYLEQDWSDRLLSIQSPYIINYLQMKSFDDIAHADLLWRYYQRNNQFYEAADVQLSLAKSSFDLPLSRRIEYLSAAKGNVSAYTPGVGRQSKQALLQEIADLLDLANIQDDLYQRLKCDPRMNPLKRLEMEEELDGPVLNVSVLYNKYAESASYYDACLQIYQVADHRNSTDIKTTWQNLLEKVHRIAIESGEVRPYEAVIEQVRSLGNKLNRSETTFPIRDLLPMLERYSFQFQKGVGPRTWVIDLFLELQISYESMIPVLEAMLYNEEVPFVGSDKKYIAEDLLYVIDRWFRTTIKGSGTIFGNEATAEQISDILNMLQSVAGTDRNQLVKCQELKEQLEQLLR